MHSKAIQLSSLAGFLFCLDQVIKVRARLSIVLGDEVALIPGFLWFIHFHSYGWGFGFLETPPSFFQEFFLTVIPIFILILLVVVFLRVQSGHFFSAVALVLIIAGALSNLFDRIYQGFVVDVLKIKFFSLVIRFNFADLYILLGLVFLISGLIMDAGHEKRGKVFEKPEN